MTPLFHYSMSLPPKRYVLRRFAAATRRRAAATQRAPRRIVSGEAIAFDCATRMITPQEPRSLLPPPMRDAAITSISANMPRRLRPRERATLMRASRHAARSAVFFCRRFTRCYARDAPPCAAAVTLSFAARKTRCRRRAVSGASTSLFDVVAQCRSFVFADSPPRYRHRCRPTRDYYVVRFTPPPTCYTCVIACRTAAPFAAMPRCLRARRYASAAEAPMFRPLHLCRHAARLLPVPKAQRYADADAAHAIVVYAGASDEAAQPPLARRHSQAFVLLLTMPIDLRSVPPTPIFMMPAPRCAAFHVPFDGYCAAAPRRLPPSCHTPDFDAADAICRANAVYAVLRAVPAFAAACSPIRAAERFSLFARRVCRRLRCMSPDSSSEQRRSFGA